ncbi:MAG: replication factor C small subunit [Candidatus Aenigmarchaeota archaeon]|nr:replication factor C small subunit [Candidatus Aenigmarchaeota archaeon]
MELQIWTEKYRPHSLSEIINQKHAVKRLKAFVKDKSVPHMLFAGPPGTGKTASAIAIARDLFGKTWHANFQETNASDARGIDVVRTRIKDFARIKPLNAPFKIVFLDESDALTTAAQHALRRTIERYSNVCRFILSCNYSSKVISPLQSRCVVFRFTNLSKEDVFKYLDRIIKGEKLKVDKSALEAIYELSEGDLRKATNILQASSSLGDKITGNIIYEVSSQAKPKDVIEMMNFAVNGNFKPARKKLHDMIIKQGLAGVDIIKACHSQIFNLNVSDEKKLQMINQIGEYDFRISEGGDPMIQLEAMLSQFMLNK